jgi:hypothetical protein
MRSLLLFVFFALAAACGSSSPAGDGGTADLARGSSGSCATANDCRLYSSYCKSAPCQCLALARSAVDPPCVVGMQSCLVDPCLDKRADCSNGACVVAQ